MQRVIEILTLSASIGLINFCVNPSKPAYIKEISAPVGVKNSDWIFVDTRAQNGDAENSFCLNELNFDFQISNFLEHWTPEKRVGIFKNPNDEHSSFTIAKRLKKDFGINEVYILKGNPQK